MNEFREMLENIPESCEGMEHANMGELEHSLESLNLTDDDILVSRIPAMTIHPSIHSYRGFYENPAITLYTQDDVDEDARNGYSSDKPSAKKLLLAIKSALAGKMFFGYKGGEFIFENDDVVYVAEESHVTEWACLGFRRKSKNRIEMLVAKIVD